MNRAAAEKATLATGAFVAGLVVGGVVGFVLGWFTVAERLGAW